MDLLDEHHSLIHTGKLLSQPDTGFEWNGWSELFVLLFDNYCSGTDPDDFKYSSQFSDEAQGQRWCDQVPC